MTLASSKGKIILSEGTLHSTAADVRNWVEADLTRDTGL